MLYLSHVSQNVTIAYASVASFNWVDVLIGCIILRSAFVGLRSDLIAESFKLTVVVLTTVFTLHYYTQLGSWFSEYVLVFQGHGDLVGFGIICSFILFFFYLMKEGWLILLKVKTSEFVDKWVGFAIALMGTYLICGLIIFALLLSNMTLFKGNARNSLFGFYLRNVAISVYETGYRYSISKVMRKEPFNRSVYAVWKKEVQKDKQSEL